MKIVFGIMSAVQPAPTVASLVDALGTDHPILIHHDWSQQPDFPLVRDNVSYVSNPRRTGWADWGFSQGILRLAAEAFEKYDFDYFQLLSPTCMPVRRVEELEAHLGTIGADFFIDAIRLDSDPNVLMSHGWRAYSAADSFHHRVLRRARTWYFGNNPEVASRHGLSFPVGARSDRSGVALILASLARRLTLQAQRGFSHPFTSDFPCYAGSTWFTMSRRGCEHLLAKAADESLTGRFAKMHMGDEMYFPSVFMNSGLRCAPAVHYIARFVDARPSWIGIEDLDEVRRSGAFFARKFPEDPASPVRAAVRAMLQGAAAREIESSAQTA